MRIVFITHPEFFNSQSMPRYTNWLATGMETRGHKVEIWQPQAYAYNLKLPDGLKKWMGYIDQYIFFPFEMKKKLKSLPNDTLFVLTDHALGPWASVFDDKPLVIHCHDFLAQRSALGEIHKNPTAWTGRQYQAFIRRGYTRGKNFISVSKTTQNDLHRLLKTTPLLSEVVYNSLLDEFIPDKNDGCLKAELQHELSINLSDGYLLHVGGNQWYKNREGIVDIYNAWRSTSVVKLPLLMVGSSPSDSLKDKYNQSPFKEDIHFLTDVSDSLVKKIYRCASVLLFPSLAEGFGWPILEAMASGCPVITTNAEPMTEVAGDAAFLIPRLPDDEHKVNEWAFEAAKVIDRVLKLSPTELDKVVLSGQMNVQRFNSANHLDKIEKIYKTVVKYTD